MADQQEEEDLRMALRMSMQHTPPEPKRSKPRDGAGACVGATAISSPEESPEAKSRRLQRELMASAAEKRMLATKSASSASPIKVSHDSAVSVSKEKELVAVEGNSGKELSLEDANQLLFMVFGSEVSKDILAQWTNQGIRYVFWSLS